MSTPAWARATTFDGEADLPDLTLPCLGSDSEASLADIGGPAGRELLGLLVRSVPQGDAGHGESFHEQYGDQVVGRRRRDLDTYPGGGARPGAAQRELPIRLSPTRAASSRKAAWQ